MHDRLCGACSGLSRFRHPAPPLQGLAVRERRRDSAANNFEENRRISEPGASNNGQGDEPPNYGTFEATAPASKPGRKLEVAVALGCDPAITYAATAPLPPEIDELVFAGFLRRSPVRLHSSKRETSSRPVRRSASSRR